MTILAYIEILCSDIPSVSGVYCIENLINKKVYIGSTNDLYLRMRTHLCQLFDNCHTNIHLQNAFNKYGVDNFIFYVLEKTLNEEKIVIEQKYFDIFLYAQEYILSGGKDKRFKELGYNICPTASSMEGYKLTDEQLKDLIIRSSLLWQNVDYVNKQVNARKRLKKPILMYDRFTGNFIKEFPSIREAAKETGFKRDLIKDVLDDDRRQTHDMVFKFKIGSVYPLRIQPVLGRHKDKDAFKIVMNERAQKQQTPILCFDLNDNLIGEYSGIKAASKKLGISYSGITSVLYGLCSKCKNYKFKYKDHNYKPKKYFKKSLAQSKNIA